MECGGAPMTDNLLADIDRFTEHFRKQVAEIQKLTTEHQELYRKILYVSVLDTLAGSVLPKRSNRERFTYFLQRFCDWTDGNRVSLPHLMQLLKKNPDPAFQKLREWTITKYKSLPAFLTGHSDISDDPQFDDVKRMWPTSADHRTPIEGVDLNALTHFQLLYVYRNMLVHEFRAPGYGMEFGEDDDKPFYHSMGSMGATGAIVGTTVELVYPQRFLHRLCNTGLTRIREYFIANELDPTDSFVFGTYWIRELNN
jgi:hypothetical protein